MATSGHVQHSCLSGLIPSFIRSKKRSSAESASVGPKVAVATAAGQAAAAPAAGLPDSKQKSTGMRQPVQTLKKYLVQKLQPSCMCKSGTSSHEPEDVQPVPTAAGSSGEQLENGGSKSKMPSLSKLSFLKSKSTKGQQASKQVVTAPVDASTVTVQQSSRPTRQVVTSKAAPGLETF